jgi:hypothetical protein
MTTQAMEHPLGRLVNMSGLHEAQEKLDCVHFLPSTLHRDSLTTEKWTKFKLPLASLFSIILHLVEVSY